MTCNASLNSFPLYKYTFQAGAHCDCNHVLYYKLTLDGVSLKINYEIIKVFRYILFLNEPFKTTYNALGKCEVTVNKNTTNL